MVVGKGVRGGESLGKRAAEKCREEVVQVVVQQAGRARHAGFGLNQGMSTNIKRIY